MRALRCRLAVLVACACAMLVPAAARDAHASLLKTVVRSQGRDALNSWEQVASELKRESHVLVALDSERVAMFGGVSNHGVLNTTWLRRLDPGDFSASEWVEQTPQLAPPARCLTGITPVGHGRALMFGGYTIAPHDFDETLLQDTWTLNLVEDRLVWAQTHPLGEIPGARMRHDLASIFGTQGDSIGVLMFGGRVALSSSWETTNETWVFHWATSSWELVPPKPTWPTGRDSHKLATLRNQQVVMFGGRYTQQNGTDGALDETWVFDARDLSWQAVATTPRPTARYDYAMTRISSTGAVLFGGYNRATFLSDTWVFNITTLQWTPKTGDTSAPAPTACWHSAMTMVRTGVAMLFGGYQIGDFLDQTWVFVLEGHTIGSLGVGWNSVGSTMGPPARSQHTAVAALSSPTSTAMEVLVFGGVGEHAGNDTWIFQWPGNGPSSRPRWVPLVEGDDVPPPRSNHGMAALSTSQALLFGGLETAGRSPLGDSWIFDFESRNWTNVTSTDPVDSPIPRNSFGIANVVDGNVVVYGGLSWGVGLSDTWVFSGSSQTWAQHSSSGAPGRLWGHAMAGCSGNAVLFGGRTGLHTPTARLYVLKDPTRRQCAPGRCSAGSDWVVLQARPSSEGKGRPVARSDHAMVSLGSNKLALFGGLAPSGYLNDMWILQHTPATGAKEETWQWSLLSVAQSPPARSLLAMSPLLNSSVLVFGGMIFSHAYVFGDAWTLRVGCQPGTFASGDASFSDATCELCPQGKFTGSHNRLRECGRCPTNTSTPQSGAWSPALCNVCDRAACPHGLCKWSKGHDIQCNCEQGFVGEHCRECPGERKCYNHGTCYEGAGGSAVCRCHFFYLGTSDCRSPVLGIALGAAVGAALLACAVCCCWRTRRREKEQEEYTDANIGLLQEAVAALSERGKHLEAFLRLDLNGVEFHHVIGRGPLSEVHSGTVPRLGAQPVALKRLKPVDRAAARFVMNDVEALLAVQQHERFVGFYGIGEKVTRGDAVSLVIASELVEGGSVRDQLRDRVVPWAHRLQWLEDVAEGMEFLHAQGHVHGNLKSTNVLVDTGKEPSRAKLCDVGWVRRWHVIQARQGFVGQAQSAPVATRPRARSGGFGSLGGSSGEWEDVVAAAAGGGGDGGGRRARAVSGDFQRLGGILQGRRGGSRVAVRATQRPVRLPDLDKALSFTRAVLLWCAPEQIGTLQGQEGDHVVMAGDARTDVYAFGVLLWEAVQGTGELPRGNLRTDNDVANAISCGEPLPSSGNEPPGALDLIRACMQMDPQARPTFSAIRAGLQDLRRQTP